MLSHRNFWVLCTLFVTFFAATVLSTPTSPQESTEAGAPDYETFQKMLEEVDESSIHSVLHSWSSKFRDGVFSKDRTATEHVHSVNPPLATKLLKVAKRASNTTTTPVVPPSSSPTSKSTSASSVKSGSSVSSIVVAKTTPSSAVVVSTNSAGVVFSNSAGSLTTVSTTEIAAATTSTPGESFTQLSSTVLSTTTLPNGALSTITGVVVVNAPATALAGTPSGSAGASATSGSPGLQSGAATPSRGIKKEMVAMVGGAVMVAMAL